MDCRESSYLTVYPPIIQLPVTKRISTYRKYIERKHHKYFLTYHVARYTGTTWNSENGLPGIILPRRYAGNVTKITFWPVRRSLKASDLLVGAISRRVLCHIDGYGAS